MSFFDKLVAWSISLVPKFFVKNVASRYIAGTTLDDAMQVVKELNEKGCCATLDVLGEHISGNEEAEHAVEEYIKALERIDTEKLDCNISVKLTMLGLKLDLDFCLENMHRLVQKAKKLKNFVRIDMEDSSCTSDTLRIFSELRKKYDNVGFVIQAYMRRSFNDILEQMNGKKKINVRVCKGIYIEPREIAFKDMEIINANYNLLRDELMKNSHYVGVATHDEKLVWSAYRTIRELNLPKDDFEFQMLLGVDEELRKIIIGDGYKVRVYVPYGEQWYEYSVRRLQENPKIARYVIKNFFGLK